VLGRVCSRHDSACVGIFVFPLHYIVRSNISDPGIWFSASAGWVVGSRERWTQKFRSFCLIGNNDLIYILYYNARALRLTYYACRPWLTRPYKMIRCMSRGVCVCVCVCLSFCLSVSVYYISVVLSRISSLTPPRKNVLFFSTTLSS